MDSSRKDPQSHLFRLHSRANERPRSESSYTQRFQGVENSQPANWDANDFMYSGAPPQWNVLARILISIIGGSILIVFLCGFRLVIREASRDLEWPATVALVSGLMWLTFSCVAQSMEAGTVIVSKVPIDPTVDGALAPGQFLLWGSIGRAMTTLFLSASGMAILRGRLMPVWFGQSAWVLAVVNVAFLPAMFFGPDTAQFYSAVGWGTTATVPALAFVGSSWQASFWLELPTTPQPDARFFLTSRSS